ncbi:MAG: Tad domain-containing protein [Acidimicrobiales bacterium]|nr:Tad domain-containing protein [Acidimicrobiales bacterium]
MLSRRRSMRQDRGGVLVLVGPMLVAILVMVAFAVDLGNARQVARHSQANVDASALAGARELPLAEADATAASEATGAAAAVLYRNVTNSAGTPTTVSCAGDAPINSTCYEIDDATIVVATPYVGTWTGAPLSHSLIFVEICQPTSTNFAGAAGLTSPTVCRDAVARRFSSTGGYGFGLVVLEPTGCKALEFSGDSETVLSSNGSVMVNSSCTMSNGGALDSSGNSWDLIANYIGVVGTATLSPCDEDCITSDPVEGIPPFDDPLALDPPDPTAMTEFSNCNSTVMEPGRYTSNCKVTSNNDDRILRPGTYYFDHGFEFNGGNIVCSNTATSLPLPADDACDGVTLVIGGGAFTLNGNGTVKLPPPDTGPYAGVSVYQLTGQESTINGTADFELGTIYAPNAPLKFTGSGGGEAVNITGQVIGRTASISGTFDFNIVVPEDAPDAVPEESIGLER